MNATLASPKNAAKYLGVSYSHFEEHIRPHLPVVDMKPPMSRRAMPRFRLVDLDAWVKSRTRGVFNAKIQET